MPKGLGMPLYFHNSHHRAKHTTEASRLLLKDRFTWSRFKRVVTMPKWEFLTTQRFWYCSLEMNLELCMSNAADPPSPQRCPKVLMWLGWVPHLPTTVLKQYFSTFATQRNLCELPILPGPAYEILLNWSWAAPEILIFSWSWEELVEVLAWSRALVWLEPGLCFSLGSRQGCCFVLWQQPKKNLRQGLI